MEALNALNILHADDRIVMAWEIGPGASFVYEALPGMELFDPTTNRKLRYIKAHNTSNSSMVVGVSRRRVSCALSFSPGLWVGFTDGTAFPTSDIEIQTETLMEPEFSLDEIHQAQEVIAHRG